MATATINVAMKMLLAILRQLLAHAFGKLFHALELVNYILGQQTLVYALKALWRPSEVEGWLSVHACPRGRCVSGPELVRGASC